MLDLGLGRLILAGCGPRDGGVPPHRLHGASLAFYPIKIKDGMTIRKMHP